MISGGVAAGKRSAASGIALQGPIDHLGHFVILIGAGPAWPELVVQTFQAAIQVTLSPLAHGHHP